jgi:hypothetical protein
LPGVVPRDRGDVGGCGLHERRDDRGGAQDSEDQPAGVSPGPGVNAFPRFTPCSGQASSHLYPFSECTPRAMGRSPATRPLLARHVRDPVPPHGCEALAPSRWPRCQAEGAVPVEPAQKQPRLPGRWPRFPRCSVNGPDVEQ